MGKKILLFGFLVFYTVSLSAQTITDIDGNVYNTVTIGQWIWMKENLRTTRYQNGDSIGTTTPATKNITTETAPAYQWSYNGADSLVATYGRMYTWYAVNDSRNICPAGWHVSSEAEWRDMSLFLGGDSVSGSMLKETGTAHWTTPNLASNSTNFTALPGGIRFGYGTFSYLNTNGAFWTASEYSATYSIYRMMVNNDTLLRRSSGLKNNAYSIRCINNNPATGTGKPDIENHLSIVPNPARNKINISFEKADNKVLVIYDMLGKQIIRKNLTDAETEIDISKVIKGIYIVEITAQGKTIRKKLMVE